MTDNEIIEALEKAMFLGDASIMKGFGTIVDKKLLSDTVDLLNRQQAKIEALTMENEKLQNDCELLKQALAQKIVSEIKSEVIKDFARKLKCGVPQKTGEIRCKDVDNLVKEMVGGNR